MSDLKVLIEVAPGHLNIHGSRQTEVENLTCDVGCLEEERLVGKFCRKDVTKFPGIVQRWVMVRLERNQNLAVPVAIGNAVAEGQVDTGIRQPDVVEHGIEFL